MVDPLSRRGDAMHNTVQFRILMQLLQAIRVLVSGNFDRHLEYFLFGLLLTLGLRRPLLDETRCVSIS